MRLKIFSQIYAVTLALLIGAVMLVYQSKINLIKDSIGNFVKIKDLSSLKYVLSPLLKSDLKSLVITEDGIIIFNVKADEGFINFLTYRRLIVLNNNEIEISFVPYYLYFGLALQSLIVILLYKLYLLKSDRDNMLSYKFTLSQKLAHDIRSPISTLNLISSKIQDSELKSLQLAVVQQINAIANDLLNDSKKMNSEPVHSHFQTTEHAGYLLKMLYDLQKEYQFKAIAISQKIIFEIDHTQLANHSANQKLTSIIYTCLNNFVQNAIEATSAQGEIKIRAIKNSDQKIEISVCDDGKGIPDHILKRLGSEVLSFGKNHQLISDEMRSGNGVALYNAQRELAEHGAELVINSVENQGTQIRILI